MSTMSTGISAQRIPDNHVHDKQNPVGITVAGASLLDDPKPCDVYASDDKNHVGDVSHAGAPITCIVNPASPITTGSGNSSLSESDPGTSNVDGVDDKNEVDNMKSQPRRSGQPGKHQSNGSSLESSDRSTLSGSRYDGHTDGEWGWYDDDHATDNGAEQKRKKKDGVSNGSLLQLIPPLVKPLDPTTDVGVENYAMAVTAPTYVLEESRSTQDLWKRTAGNRPPQPVEDRAFYEMIWAQNFSRSQAKYDMPLDILTASSPISLSPFADSTFAENEGNADCTNYNLAAPFNNNVANRIGKNDDGNSSADPSWVKAAEADAAEATLIHGILKGAGVGKQNYTSLKSMGPHHHHHTLVNKKVKGTGSGGDLTVLVRGDNVFGTTVSKSFAKTSDRALRNGNDTVSVSIASYRVVESKKHGKYAQYLVIYCEGSFRDTVGVWKRYSDFSELSQKISAGHQECSFHPFAITEEHETEVLPNALTSWKLLKKRQRWYRCLDAGYLSLKVFLLERFLHDILFESSHPQILRDFVGVDDVSQ